MRSGGLTMLATYVFWNHHEEQEGVFDFSGRRDLAKFLEICGRNNMPVVLRIGPWDHGECVDGGFPGWLIDRCGADTKRLRSLDPAYMAAVERFWRRLFKEVDGHLWKQGGAVVGVQIENECRGPWPYMQALKDLAVKIGFDVPFYTRTGWPQMNGRVKYGELLPLFGDYADGFWERNLKEPSPGNYLRAFDFSNVRTSANIATEQLPQSLADDAATAQYPYFTCELGGGMPSSYHRRVRVTPMDTYAMALVRLGSGSNLLGYYMYAGGTNPNRPQEGVFFNERQSSRYTNHNDLPPFSYEFYAPVSEFGEATAAWHLLKPLHEFCANFAADFATNEVHVIDSRNAVRGPFRFHSDYVRTKNTSCVPYIFPENWRTPYGTIKSATAQPVGWEGDTLVMMAIPGIEPKVEFAGNPFKIKFIPFPKTKDDPLPAAAVCTFAKIKSATAPREIKTGSRNVAEQPSEQDWEAAAEWEISIPGGKEQSPDAILEVDYLGDVARVYVDGVPVADDFYKALPLRCALWRIPKGKITVRILPWTDSPLIYVEMPYRPATTGAEIHSVRMVDASQRFASKYK
ncbi:MAG: beta-galactosidase [Kiritimatiellae bacterium]|nr:beta-galactosidase [Kiritimatiellia bacterium]